MKVKLLDERGFQYAMLGLSLNKKQPIDRMKDVADKLSHMDGGHSKFLESIMLWIDVTAPRYWWQQFDTYRVGITKQSESTMHTILKGYLKEEDFEGGMNELFLKVLNSFIDQRDFDTLKKHLPESFLQRRIICMNYKSFRHMYYQRIHHRLDEWQFFLNCVMANLEHPEFITKDFRGTNFTEECC